MANTAADLARDVGLELGIISANAELSADESVDLQRISKYKHAEWRAAKKFCYWDEDDIPDEVMRPLTLVLASESGKQFGVSVSDEGLDEAKTRDRRLSALISIASAKYSGSRATVEYF